MAIRPLIIDPQGDPKVALQEIMTQWQEMSGQVLTADNVMIEPEASVTPARSGQMVFQLTNNTTLVVKVRGSDGTVRSTTLTLA